MIYEHFQTTTKHLSCYTSTSSIIIVSLKSLVLHFVICIALSLSFYHTYSHTHTFFFDSNFYLSNNWHETLCPMNGLCYISPEISINARTSASTIDQWCDLLDCVPRILIMAMFDVLNTTTKNIHYYNIHSDWKSLPQ